MSYRINKPYIKEYAAEVASSICDDFYQKYEKIDGKHLVNLTEIRQLNLFLVKKMYLRWQEEGAALHSPYFNYSAPEVRQTFNKLMNVLSKNISIARSDFEPFLAASIRETIYFLIDPPTYFETLYDGFDGKINVKTQIFPLKKYFRYHFPLIEKYFDALEEEANKLKSKKALKVLNKCMKKYPALLSNASEVINEFDVYKQFILDDAYVQQEDLEEEESELTESDFGLETGTAESIADSKNKEEEQEEKFEYEDFSDEEEKLGDSTQEETKDEALATEESDQAEPIKNEIAVEESASEESASEESTIKQSSQEDADSTSSIEEEAPALQEEKQGEEKSFEEKKAEEQGQEEDQKENPSAWENEEKALKDSKNETESEEEGQPLISSEKTLEDSIESEKEEDGFNDFMLRDEIEEEAEGVTKAKVPDADEDNEEHENKDMEQEEAPKTLLEKLQQSQQKDGNNNAKPSLFTNDYEEEEEEDERGYATINEKLKVNEGSNKKQLKGNIPLNMKLRYKKELFGDDQTEFDNAIDLIDQCSDYHEAINLLKEKFVSKYSWDFSEESTREFLSMIDNNFH